MVEKEAIEFDPSVFEDDEVDTAGTAAYTAARTVELGVNSNGAKFFLEPMGSGALRGIIQRRGSTKLPTPDALQGAYTDVLTAQKAVSNYLSGVGKKKPAKAPTK